jgi:hypothetical protein
MHYLDAVRAMEARSFLDEIAGYCGLPQIAGIASIDTSSGIISGNVDVIPPVETPFAPEQVLIRSFNDDQLEMGCVDIPPKTSCKSKSKGLKKTRKSSSSDKKVVESPTVSFAFEEDPVTVAEKCWTDMTNQMSSQSFDRIPRIMVGMHKKIK